MDSETTFAMVNSDAKNSAGFCEYEQLTEMITRWLAEYEQIQPMIEEFCKRSNAQQISVTRVYP